MFDPGPVLSAFPGRVITTDCIRSGNWPGVHYQPAPSRRQLGFEVLCDVYLAARCDRLIGLGFTNVSNLILQFEAMAQRQRSTARKRSSNHHSNFMLQRLIAIL